MKLPYSNTACVDNENLDEIYEKSSGYLEISSFSAR